MTKLQSALVSQPDIVSTNSNIPWGRCLRNGVLVGLSVGLTFGCGIGLSFTQQHGLVYGMIYGIHNGLTYGLAFFWIGVLLSIILIRMDVGIHPTERLVWSRHSLQKSFLSKKHWGDTLKVSLSLGAGLGLTSGLSTFASQVLSEHNLGFEIRPILDIVTSVGDGLAYTFTFFIAYGLLMGLLGGLSRKKLDKERRIRPNEGIRRSLRISVQVGIISGIVSGLVGTMSMMVYSGLHAALAQGWDISFSSGLSAGFNDATGIGLTTGLYVGLQSILFGSLLAFMLMGGLACLRHSILRLLLWQSGNIPLKYTHFLDNAASRILLRKVGGGYEFIHALLLEYFISSMNDFDGFID